MSVVVSKKHGINPTMALCSICGEETDEILLLGKCNEYKCLDCGATTFGSLAGIKMGCPQCNSHQMSMVASDVEAPRRLKSEGICEKCKAKGEEHAALVRQGGVYWRCHTCGSAGIIRPGAEIALIVRHKTQIVAPNSVGVDFTSKDCPICQGRI